MATKNFKLIKEQIQDLARGHGGCIASDRITVDGFPVGYMVREEPNNPTDSGWVFLSGEESQAYLDNADNLEVYDVNTIANYDPEIIPFLEAPLGSAFARDNGGRLLPAKPPPSE